MQLVISAFPGCGKSTICKEAEQYGLVHVPVSLEGVISNRSTDGKTPIFDSDSSLFAKEHFPGNYIEHIKEVLKNHPDVVIMVSSHDNVREAMREAGIEYTLVAPQRELKGEYLERYQGRGSPEAFITMMENKWNDFIDSIENDPSTSKLVLSEGEYLVDKISDRIKETVKNMSVEGNESIDDFKDIFTGATDELKAVIANDPPVTITEDGSTAGTTAVIIDVNANANNPDVIQPEPSGEVIVGVVNQPESIEDSTLTAGKLEGGVIAIDASTVDNPALAGNEDLELAEMKVEWVEQDRADLIEAKFDIQNDIDALEGIVVISKDETHAGFESLVDNSETLVAAADNINLRYGTSVEPTIAGMEGFLDILKGAMAKIKETFKGKPNKEAAKIIKRQLADAVKAVDVYKSPKWLEDNKFINVGKTKVSVPDIFKESTDAGDVRTVVNGIISRAESMHTKYLNNAKSRLTNGTKIFNKFKNSDPEKESIEDLKKAYPIEPSQLKGAESDSGLREVGLKTSKIEIPVLSKKSIPDIVAVMSSLIKFGDDIAIKNDAFISLTVPEDNLYNSKFWESISSSKEFGMIWDAVSYDCAKELVDIQYAADDVIFDICKFLESWILNSVK